MASKKLMDFIKKHLNNKRISESDEGLAAWKRKNGIDTDAAISKAVVKASTDYQKNSATYGKVAEGLAESRLGNSGYAKYLETEAKKKGDYTLTKAENAYAADTGANVKGYARHLEQMAEQRNKIYENVKKNIASDGIVNYDAAYELGISSGLSAEDAESAAKEVTERLIAQRRLKVVEAITAKRFGSERTREYALALGLPESIVDELVEMARQTNEVVSAANMSGYLDYLRELANKKK